MEGLHPIAVVVRMPGSIGERSINMQLPGLAAGVSGRERLGATASGATCGSWAGGEKQDAKLFCSGFGGFGLPSSRASSLPSGSKLANRKRWRAGCHRRIQQQPTSPRQRWVLGGNIYSRKVTVTEPRECELSIVELCYGPIFVCSGTSRLPTGPSKSHVRVFGIASTVASACIGAETCQTFCYGILSDAGAVGRLLRASSPRSIAPRNLIAKISGCIAPALIVSARRSRNQITSPWVMSPVADKPHST